MRTSDSSCFVLQVELIVNPSDEVIPKLRTEFGLERLDFVFMDHWKKCYAPDLQVIFNSNSTFTWWLSSSLQKRAGSPNDFLYLLKIEK